MSKTTSVSFIELPGENLFLKKNVRLIPKYLLNFIRVQEYQINYYLKRPNC